MSTATELENAPKIPLKVYGIFGAMVVLGVIVGTAQMLPPLTEPDADFRKVSDRAKIYQVDELAFCQQTMTGVDCGCFSYQASAILRSDQARVRGMAYADKWELAVAQAGAACRR